MSTQLATKANFQIEILAKVISNIDSNTGYVYIMGHKKTDLNKIIANHNVTDKQKLQLKQNDKNVLHFENMWIVLAPQLTKNDNHMGLLDQSSYAWYREQLGSLISHIKASSVQKVCIHFHDCDQEVVRAIIVGLEMASYSFLENYKNKIELKPLIQLAFLKNNKLVKINPSIIKAAHAEAAAIQLARHLVNLPPNDINPATVEEAIKKQLKFSKNTNVEVWDSKKLKVEGMNLLLAVGAGSDTAPRMIRLSYRPTKKNKKQPIAFVGKGITFDTGGLDIKPSSAMRLMKKDMGGAAAVLGLAYWADQSGYGRACDFYLALAENSVDAKAMRPSDVYKSRAGYLVEIDNTDAEGRLVLADVMDVAAKQTGQDEPEYLIDIATLTGAIKVALGADMAGLFSNDDQLATQIQKAGVAAGDMCWRMPLVKKYFNSMSSNFADFKNSADGFGGAITAALFLEKFTAGKKWAHLDVYSWNDKVGGSVGFAGGSGQPVQAMIQWLKQIS